MGRAVAVAAARPVAWAAARQVAGPEAARRAAAAARRQRRRAGGWAGGGVGRGGGAGGSGRGGGAGGREAAADGGGGGRAIGRGRRGGWGGSGAPGDGAVGSAAGKGGRGRGREEVGAARLPPSSRDSRCRGRPAFEREGGTASCRLTARRGGRPPPQRRPLALKIRARHLPKGVGWSGGLGEGVSGGWAPLRQRAGRGGRLRRWYGRARGAWRAREVASGAPETSDEMRV